MKSGSSWTLSEAATILAAPQHQLIHLCEKGVVRPAIEEARGRGSSRRFSRRNLLEFAVALKLRELMIPVAVAGAVVHVLATTEKAIAREVPGFNLPDSLIGGNAPELRVIITDGLRLFFAIHVRGTSPKVLGGVDVGNAGPGELRASARGSGKKGKASVPAAMFEPTSHERGRVEVSVTGLAKDLNNALNG